MQNSFARRAGASALGLALAGSALSVALVHSAPGAYAAATPVPNAEAKAAAAWVGSQFSGGLLEGSAGSGFGQNLDLGISLAATGASPSLLGTLRGGVDAAVASYVDTAYSKPAAAAKASYFYSMAGGDPAHAGADSRDLVAEVEAAVDDSGKFSDTYSDTYSQWWAVLALSAADRPEAAAARDYLVGQACSGGGWGDDNGKCGDTYSTSLALTALAAAPSTPASAAAVTAGATWLAAQASRVDGSFDTCTTYDSSWNCTKREADTNSTGLAAVALAKSGRSAQAAKAATWVAAHQIVSLPGCPRPGHGALMWTQAQFAQGMNDDTLPNAVGATAQALAALAYLPANTPKVAAPTTYVAARQKVKVSVAGLRAGQQACITGGAAGVKVGANGAVTLTTPAGTATRTIRLTTVGGSTTATIKVLAAARLKVTATAKVKRGKKVTVVVRGLAKRERVSVKLAGKKVAVATANYAGVAKLKVTVPKRTKVSKKAKIMVVGQFANRNGATTFKVTK